MSRRATQMDRPGSVIVDMAIAMVLTVAGAALAWLLVGGLPFVGIDDAAITRSYADNVARGAGYVYNIGGERVEGSTAFLWMSMLTVLYALFADPSIPILLLSALFATLAVLAALRLVTLLANLIGSDVELARLALIIALLGMPGYFLWSVWTMMELALWSAAILWLALGLARLVEGRPDSASWVSLIILAAAVPLIRPEGIAVCLGLLGLAALLRPSSWPQLVSAGCTAIATWGALTLFRLAYFGQPVPNTFYAKVSSDLIDGLKDGLRYLIDFVLSAPFVDLMLAVWVAAALVAVGFAWRSKSGGRAAIVVSAVIVGMLSIYAGLGGDHFILWRFYQPIIPILPIALALGLSLIGGQLRFYHMPVMAIAALMVLASWMHYFQSRYEVRPEFWLVEEGVAFGTYLNAADPRPVVGTGPAGGIALGYEGRLLDLLGLNWVEMAHANPIKEGMRNHASFDLPTFWKHAPDLVTTFNVPCERPPKSLGFDGLFLTDRFQAEYVPVQFRTGDHCWPGYAKPAWIQSVKLPGISVRDWGAGAPAQ